MKKWLMCFVMVLCVSGFGQQVWAVDDPNVNVDPNAVDPNMVDPNVIEPNDVVENIAPVADAGDDITAFAGADGTATVLLDGSDSNDADGDELTYHWTWTASGQVCESNEVDPEIKLPFGDYVISLTVSDGTATSSDEVAVKVIEPYKFTMKFTPQTLNLRSSGRYVMAHFTLDAGFEVNDVNAKDTMTLEPYGLPSLRAQVGVNSEGLVTVNAVFDRMTLGRALATITTSTAKITVSGKLADGSYFFGTDNVKVLKKIVKPKKKVTPVRKTAVKKKAAAKKK